MSKKHVKSRLILGSLLLLLSFVCFRFHNSFSNNIYPVLVSTIGRLFSIAPFSVIELLLYIFIVLLVFFIIRLVKQRHFAGFFSGLYLFCAILFFLYTIGCGINYKENSFIQKEGFKDNEIQSDVLQSVCVSLTEKVNKLALKVERDDAGAMSLSSDERIEGIKAMKHLAVNHPTLKGYYPSPKRLLFPALLSYQGITGIYVPFTYEANYNQSIPDYAIPFTICHELSHLKSFMKEDEANFIAYLACTNSSDTDFQYSGYFTAWMYCMEALQKLDSETYDLLCPLLSDTAEYDLAANSRFWSKYDGVLSDYQDFINDNYLKLQGQTAGVKSYNHVASLIVSNYNQ